VSRLRVGLDLDGVLYNWERTIREMIEARFSIRLRESTGYDYIKEGVPAESWASLWQEPALQEMFTSGFSYYDGLFAARKIQETDDLVILTRRPREARRYTHSWLMHRLIHPMEVIHFTDGRPKSSVYCDLYVDDSGHEVEELASAGRTVLIPDRTWNQDCAAGTRFTSWATVLDAIQSRKAALAALQSK
jgi:uncharacterized HAD superfamily protein